MIDKFGRVQVKFYRETNNPLPIYSNHGDAGMDIRSNEDTSIAGFAWGVVSTGLYVVIPYGYEGQVRSRSGLAAKKGITVLNSPGTIDADYRGEIGVILINLSSENYMLNPGERVAQLVISRYEKVSWDLDRDLDNTTRGNKTNTIYKYYYWSKI